MRPHRVGFHGMLYCHPASTSAPMFHPRDISRFFFWAVEFALCALSPAVPKSPPRKKQRQTIAQCGNKQKKPRINHSLLNCPLPILLVM